MAHADHLLDRIKLKQQLMRWRTATVFALLALVISVIYREEAGFSLREPHIARISIEGMIVDDEKRDELIEKLRTNKKVKAVIVKLDTPGGTGAGGQQLYLSLRELAAEKPVVATMRTMATSAGYMTAIATDHIVAQESTITGSIGVILQSFNLKQLAEEYGIRPITLKSGALKGSPSTFEDFKEKERAVLQSVIDDFYTYFVDLVSERRKLSAEQLRNITDGRVFSGRQAHELGLIDALGGEKEALAWLRENHDIDGLEVINHKVKKPKGEWLENVQQFFGGNPMEFPSLGLDGLMLIWQPHANFGSTH